MFLDHLDTGAVGAHASQVCLLYCHLPHVRVILCFLFGRNFKNVRGKCLLLVLCISTTHSKECIEGKGGSHDFVKFSFTI